MKHEEDDNQKALMQWANLATIGGVKVGDYLFAIPNGGKRNPREAARLKAQGVKSGVSDLFLPVTTDCYHGLWIEMKSKAGRATENQVIWGSRMLRQGYDFRVCYSATEAINCIKEYLEINEIN